MPMMKRNVVLPIAAAVFLVAAVALNWWLDIKDSEPAPGASQARTEASSPGYFSVKELSDASDVIVVGVFGDVISREVDYGIAEDDSFEDDWGIPMVFHRVEVKERLRGEPGSEIIVALFDTTRVATNEVKPIEEGKRYILFLFDITEDARRFEKYADADKDIYITLSDDIGIFELSEDDIATPRESVISRRTPDGDVVSSFSLQEIRIEVLVEPTTE
ncbi:MAG: hypothetical protein F4X34_08575 [Chloroflexi bacterium]|nr:hypothetical protein [Chloroflexota bacterium]